METSTGRPDPRPPVDLWEDNAGGLALSYGEDVWTELEMVRSTFREDAEAIRNDLTDGWTVPHIIMGSPEAASLPRCTLVATYRPGWVQIRHWPGAAAAAYLGPDAPTDAQRANYPPMYS